MSSVRTEIAMKRLALIALTLIALLTVTVWHDAPTYAASRLTEDLAELFKSAELVVAAEVLDRQAGAVGAEGVPMTSVTLKIQRVFKGSGTDTGEVVRAEYLGGSSGSGMQTIVPGQPNLVPGSRVVVMLSKFGRTPHWRVIGGDAGEIDFALSDDGRPLVHRASGGKFDFFVSDAQSLTGYRNVNVSALNENQFLQLFEAIATTGRPVIETQAAVAVVLKDQTVNFSAPEPKPTSDLARSQVAPIATVTLSAAPAETSTGFSLTGRLVVTLLLTSLAWVIGHRSIHSLRELRAKRG